MHCCERGCILIEIYVTIEKKFYLVRYPACLWIITRPWDVAFLVYSRWSTSRSALISGSIIKCLNCHAKLCLLICSLSGHRLEETRVCWPWDMWCAEPQVYLRDQPIFVSEVYFTLVAKSYLVWYSVRLWIKISPWAVALT